MQHRLANVSLEITPKPLFRKDDAFVLALFRDVFLQWHALLRHADQVSLLWWLSDGTDLLVHNRDWDAPIEWMFWQGFAHPTYDVPLEKDPGRDSITATPRIYRPDAVELTGRDVRRIVEMIRRAGREALGRDVRVGVAFDPGCEFSNHPFRYRDHPELLIGDRMKCIDCTTRLHADPRPFAGFPGGLPEGTPFGRFFGRQARLYLADMGFDYLWLSNSFGFGRSPYAFGGVGQFFDGETYRPEGNVAVRDAILEFWRLFREECPGVGVECRGTDFTLGMNLVNHATPYAGMYASDFGIDPPPNTPWPALTRNHGLALAGYMSQIAGARGSRLPLRFYTSDPWFCNSPWFDRWERRPHDLYLAGAVCRIDEDGTVRAFNDVKFLSIDTSWGEVPEQIPDEVIPHVKRAVAHRPDAVPPVVWLYPFTAYHRYAFERTDRLGEVMAGDLLVQHAINTGLPLSGVVTTEAFATARIARPGLFGGSVLVSPVPEAGSAWADALADHLERGGAVLCYGPSGRADDRWRTLLGVAQSEPIEGVLSLRAPDDPDRYRGAPAATVCEHLPALNAGGIGEVPAVAEGADCRVLATVAKDGVERLAALVRADPAWRGGRLAWVRGTSSVTPAGVRGRNLAAYDPADRYPCEQLLRHALGALGWTVAVERSGPGPESVHLMVSRCRNGFVFAGFSPDPDLVLRLRTPLGAPVLPGRDGSLENGALRWPVWHWFHEECRVFVEQRDGRISLHPEPAKHPLYRVRWVLTGLRDAIVRFFPESGCEGHTSVLVNPDLRYCIVGETCASEWVETAWGRCLELRHVTGTATFAWAPDDAVEPVKAGPGVQPPGGVNTASNSDNACRT